MALVLAAKLQINNSADRLWVVDKTGQYVTTTNEGGWGSPNHELNQSALVAVPLRQDSSGNQPRLAPVSQAAYFNAGAANNDETEIEFYYVNDGQHGVYFFRIPVSNDGGATDLETNALVIGDYFFDLTLVDIYTVQSGGNILVTDYRDLIDVVQTNVYQILCQDIFSGQSAIKRQQEYRKYKDARTTNLAEDPLFLTSWRTTLDIIGSEYTFRSGLLAEAQNQVESLLDEKDIDDVNAPQPEPV